MNDAEITLIRYRIDRSKEALSAAKLLYEQGHYNDAVNQLYFYIENLVLLARSEIDGSALEFCV